MIAVWNKRLELSPYPGHRDWFFLTADWDVRLGEYYSLHVPEGYITDGPSVPWLVQPLTPITGHSRIAATIHDALYSIQGDGELITRQQSDKIFYDLLPKTVRSRLMYAGLRAGGWLAWVDESEADKLNTQQGTLPQIQLV